jgi:hypothetical protein
MPRQIIGAEGHKPAVVKYVEAASPETLQVKIAGVLETPWPSA